jgi:hypothetical protein
MRGISRFSALCALYGAAACGNVSDKQPLDAAPTLDASPDASLPPPTIYHWVVDKQLLPKTNAEAKLYGLDLNADGVVDNQLGAVFAALTSQGIDLQAIADAAVARGQILMLGAAALGVGAPDGATFTLYTGTDPQPPPCNGTTDVVCRRHLTGTGAFGIAATSAHDQPLSGTIASSTLVAGPGHLQVAVVFPGVPVLLDLIGARVRLQSVGAGSLGQSVIAGGVTVTQRDTRIYPAMQQSMSAQVAIDCPTLAPPDCGCAAGSLGRTYLSLFDISPKDCKITLDEVANNTLIKSLFAPDVKLEGQDAISLGFSVTAVKATFTP